MIVILCYMHIFVMFCDMPLASLCVFNRESYKAHSVGDHL